MNNNVINVPHTARFHSLHFLTIRSNLVWYGDHTEQVTINYKSNNENHNTPCQKDISDTNPISVTFLNDFWYDNIHFYVNESNPKSFTAYYNDANSLNLAMTHYGIPEWPSSTPRNLTFAPENSGSNARVKLTWQEHPNQYVSKYEIWRSVSGTGTSSKIAEVDRGTTSYIDPDYYYTYSGACTVQMVNYDVRAYYSIEQTTSPESFQTAKLRHPDSQSKSISDVTTEIKDYSLSNYPNPFNPTTRIEYQLPKAGEVSIKVYNSLGKEVATLVNGRLEEGKYTTEFDGSDLSSGMYFYVLRANEKTIVNKMLLIK